MEEKDYKEMSNAEIKLYQEVLRNEYEATKKKWVDLGEELDRMDRLWNNIEAELKRRNKRW